MDLLQDIIEQIKPFDSLNKTLKDIIEKCEIIIEKLKQSESVSKDEIIKRLFNILMSNIYLPHVEDNSLFQFDSNNVIPEKTKTRLKTNMKNLSK